MTSTVVTGQQQPALKRPGLGAAWFLLITMGGASLTFNVYHAGHHAGHLKAALPWGLAILAGVVPVLAATVVSHIVAEFKGGTIMEAAAFGAMLIAMALSMDATASVVRPIFGPVMCWGLPAAMDVTSMVALRIILKYAAAGHAPGQLADAVPGTAAELGNHDDSDGSPGEPRDGSPGLVPGPGSRNQAANSDAPGEPVPAGGSGNQAGPAEGSGGRESRDAVTDEMTSRPRPPLSTGGRERRALDIVAEFRARTGLRMNNGELARVLGMRKADVGPVRAAIQDREESAA